MQPFPHPNDASYKIWSRLANWPQKYSSFIWKVIQNHRMPKGQGKSSIAPTFSKTAEDILLFCIVVYSHWRLFCSILCQASEEHEMKPCGHLLTVVQVVCTDTVRPPRLFDKLVTINYTVWPWLSNCGLTQIKLLQEIYIGILLNNNFTHRSPVFRWSSSWSSFPLRQSAHTRQ